MVSVEPPRLVLAARRRRKLDMIESEDLHLKNVPLAAVLAPAPSQQQ
jgi:hypothetical protein